jgi:hypothetical protein
MIQRGRIDIATSCGEVCIIVGYWSNVNDYARRSDGRPRGGGMVLEYPSRPRDGCTLADDAPLHMRLCKVPNAFQEGHGMLAKESTEEPSAAS